MGVAYSLILQALQLRASQLQVSRATQLEIVKIILDNPDLLSSSPDPSDPKAAARFGPFLNYRIKQLELSYCIDAISSESVMLQAAKIFGEPYPLEWWGQAREIYKSEARTRRERRFFDLVDSEFASAKLRAQSAQ